jgi:hypothetical protein
LPTTDLNLLEEKDLLKLWAMQECEAAEVDWLPASYYYYLYHQTAGLSSAKKKHLSNMT